MDQLPTAKDFMRVASELDKAGQKAYISGLGIKKKKEIKFADSINKLCF